MSGTPTCKYGHGPLNDDGACDDCGWRPAGARRAVTAVPEPERDDRCRFEHNGQRCLLLATVDRRPQRAGLCVIHADPNKRGRGVEQDAIFRHMQTAEGRRAMVERLVPPDEFDLEARLREHPDEVRRPDESTGAYARRMLRKAKSLARGAIRPMPGSERESA